jgi:hypothetical protein
MLRRLVAASLVAASLVAAPGSGSTTNVAEAAACGSGALTEAELDAVFARPGIGATAAVQGFGGGDYPHAYPLPDGRILWLFQDLHFSNDDDLLNDVPDGSPTNAAHNAGLVQQGRCWTIVGSRGRDLIGDLLTVDSQRWFWPLDGEIGPDGNLWLFVAEMTQPNGTGAGPGALPVRTWLAILDRDDFRQLYLEPAPDDSTRLFGWSVVSTDRWSYLYSHCYRQFANPVAGIGEFDATCMPHTYLARVPRGQLADPPEYWNGSGWTSVASAAVPVSSRFVANPMSVQWFGDVFVSVTKRDEWWGSQLVVDRAPAPQGPWTTVTTRSVLGDMKCPTCGNYGAFLLPWLDAAGRMTVALSSGAEFDLWRRNASLYRPTFHTFPVPAPPSPFAAANPPAFALPAGTSGFTPVDPVRLVDSRAPGQAFDRLEPGETSVLDLRDRRPAGATAVVLNVATDRSDADGWVRLWPCAQSEPPTANINPIAGRVVSNAATVPLGDGRLCLRSHAATDVIVDLNGWLSTSSDIGLVPVVRRLVDTRDGTRDGTSDGTRGPSRLAPGTTIAVQVTTPGSSVRAAALTVTAVDPSDNGYVTAWPCGTPQPFVANLNPLAGVTRPNLVHVRVGADGRVCLFSAGATDLVVDQLAEFRAGAGARFAPVAPQRLLDTRIDGRPAHASNNAAVIALGDVVAAQVNLTATDTSAPGYLTAYPCLSQVWPGTANGNFVADDTASSAALLVPSRGYGCVSSSVASELVVDIAGVWR